VKRLFYFSALVAGLIGTATAAPSAETTLSSHFLTRGEQAQLLIVVQGGQPDRSPVLPEVKFLTVESIGPVEPRRSRDGTRRIEWAFPYRISSYTKGHYVIPAADVSVGGEKVRTQPVDIDIIDDMALQRQEVKVGNQMLGYYAFFQATKSSPYVGEKVPVELKVYFPADRTQRVQDWGIPDFERDGVSAWRFQPQQNNLGIAKIGVRDYYSASYPSTLSANKEGKVRIGPATLRLQTYMAETNSDEPADLQIPGLELNARPLPGGAPEGFENAIGAFKLEVNVNETEVHEGDPISATLIVSGSGNLDTIGAPKPLDADGWKLYDAIPNQRGDERRELSGVVAFTQLMRPLHLQSSVPAFTFSYFNPATDKYETLISNSIPLTVLPSTNPPVGLIAPPKAMPVPVEQMTDILGIIASPKGLLASRHIIPDWAWQLIPGLFALGLLSRLIANHLSSKVRKDPDSVARAKELREVERAPDERSAFYRAAGHFAERWLGDSKDPELAGLLSRRDEVAFRPETASMKIDRSERGQVLRVLKKLALPLIAMLLVLSPQRAKAEEDTPQKAYSESRYADAAKLWLESGPYDRLSGDTLFNIGDAAYRLGAPGDAALYYRRALERQGSHAEARQNLRFLERKFGSITVQHADYQVFLSQMPLSFWKNVIIAGGWLLVIGLLISASTFRSSGMRLTGVLSLCFAPLALVIGMTTVHYYPDDARFAPAKEQMVVVADQSIVRTDAARNATEIIQAPAGSLCRVTSRSGEWAYVEFANETHSRGWVPNVDIEPLIPTTPPEPPKVHPHTASEGNNA
jgi:tetratricopeptide (TPR) repeat protein